MKAIFISTTCLLFSFLSFGQNTREIYKVKTGTDISKSIPADERFQFKEFRDGKVHFRDGSVSSTRLNYSLVHGEVQFIDPKRDTLLIADNNFVHRITIAEDTFYYFKGQGHIQQVANFNSTKLGGKLFLLMKGSEKYAAYGQHSSTSAITSYSSYSNRSGEMMALEGNDRVIMVKKLVHFWIDKNYRFSFANKSNLLKIYPRHRKLLNQYIEANNINFEKKEDLIKVLEYSSRL